MQTDDETAKDDIIWKFAIKLARQNFQLYLERYPEVFLRFPLKRQKVRFFEGLYFRLLYQANDLLFFTLLPDKEKSYQYPIKSQLKKITTGLLGRYGFYKCMQYGSETWDELSRQEQNKFRTFYHAVEESAFTALMFWSGGYANKSVNDAFDELVGSRIINKSNQ